MGEKTYSQAQGLEHGRGMDSRALVAESVAVISGRMWLLLFVATQAVRIASVLLWPHMLWLPLLCDAVMAVLTFFFAGDRLRASRRDVRLIWTMIMATMALLAIGHFYQFWILFGAETNLPSYLQLAKVSEEGFSWYSAFVTARLVPLEIGRASCRERV